MKSPLEALFGSWSGGVGARKSSSAEFSVVTILEAVVAMESIRFKGGNSPVPGVEIEVEVDNLVTKVSASGPPQAPAAELVKVEWEVEITPL